MKKDDVDDRSRSLRIKEGIVKARLIRGKWGRPTIIETKGDPQIALKAAQMRSQGLSWSEIASILDIGRTSARRLVNLYQKDGDSQTKIDADIIESYRKVKGTFSENKDNQGPDSNTANNQGQYPQISSNDDVLSRLPKTFQIFNSLLERARQKQAK